VRLRVLGNPDRYLAPLSGGSGYLLEGAAGERILLDCGGGVREALAHMQVDRLDAVVLSHFHHDHVLDLVTLRDALDAGTQVFVPAGEAKRLDLLAQAFVFEGAFDLPGPVREGARDGRVGSLRLAFAPTQHSAPSMATRIEEAGAALVYASDTAPCEELRRLVRPGDALLMHTLLPDLPADQPHHKVHSTVAAAARLARETQAGALWLSHRYHGIDAAEHLRAAGDFPSARLLAPGETFTV
jgi:ribonuclease BN (tRNA processing enzyme)